MASYDSTTRDLLSNARTAQINAQLHAGRLNGALRSSDASGGGQQAAKQSLNYARPTTPQREVPSFGDLFDGVDDTNKIIARVDAQMDSWVGKYFPAINGHFGTVPESILIDIMMGVEQGYVAQYFAQTYTRARDRAFRTANSAKETARADFTSRGFSIPQAAVAHAMNKADLQAQDVLAQVNVDILAQDATLRNDLLKMAVDQATRLKTALMGVAVDYAKSWINLPDQELERAKVKAQTQTALYQALSSFYQVEIAYEQIRLSAASEQLRSDTTIEQVRASERTEVDNSATALADAVNGLSSIAAGAYSAAGTLVAQIEST